MTRFLTPESTGGRLRRRALVPRALLMALAAAIVAALAVPTTASAITPAPVAAGHLAFTSAPAVGVGGRPAGIATGDLDGDGDSTSSRPIAAATASRRPTATAPAGSGWIRPSVSAPGRRALSWST